MAHEISVVNGKAQAAFYQKRAWHGLGEVIQGDRAPTADEIMVAAGLDVPVVPRQLALAGSDIIVPGWVANVRSDNNDVLGIVTEDYKIIQNREAFKFLDSLQQDGVMRYESAFALRGGRRVCILARLPSVIDFGDNDQGEKYVLFSTGHDGDHATRVMPTCVRVVCANTQRLAISIGESKRSVFSIVHVGDVGRKLDLARQYISQFDRKFDLYRDQAAELLATHFTQEQKEEFLSILFPAVADDAGIRTKNNLARKLSAVQRELDGETIAGLGQEGSWWGLLNAVTGYVDHRNNYKGDERQRSERRLESLVYGPAASLKDHALSLALQRSGVAERHPELAVSA
jgi:phage/plasmid-like protein (TIGR03299 family)